MHESPANPRPRFRRRRYLIDRRLQFGVAARLVVPVSGVAVLSGAAILLFARRDQAAVLGVADLTRFLLVAGAIYFALQTSILIVATLVLTHRIAGPAFVMRQALQGMLVGDDDRRLTLRKYDYLLDLAADIAAVRDRQRAERDARASALADLDSALAAEDLEAARRHLARVDPGQGAKARPPARIPHL